MSERNDYLGIRVTSDLERLEGSHVRESATRMSNLRKKRRIYRRDGVEGLIAFNAKKWKARELNLKRKSASYVKCAFECEGVRRGKVINGKISLAQPKGQYCEEERVPALLEKGLEERSVDEVGLGDTSTFDVDDKD